MESKNSYSNLNDKDFSNTGKLYSQSACKNIKRTCILNASGKGNDQFASGNIDIPNGRNVRITVQSRPIAGLLYSVSRTSLGELFPVYTGRNTIGSEPDCDICLQEDTVSPNHAVLLIRVLPDQKGQACRRVMSIVDYDSEFGTSANGIRVGYDSVSLSGGDRIQIGNAYEFVFIPLDSVLYGLTPSLSFKATLRQEERQDEVNIPKATSDINSFYNPVSEEEIFPNVVGIEDENRFYGRTYRRKEDHSNNKTIL